MPSGVKAVGAVVMAGLLTAGCATTVGGAKQAEAMDGRVAALESQVSALEARVGDLQQRQEAALVEAAAASAGQGKSSRLAGKRRLGLRQIQQALAAAGYYQGRIDGKEGPKTKEAIKNFQQAQGLKADGIVGSATTEALAKYLNEGQGS